jgi:hypothetical protein
MRLTAASSSIIHQLLDNQINVIYNPANHLFDHILSTCVEDINYYVLSENTYNISENCRNISSEYIDLYNYDINLYNEIISLIQSKNNIDRVFHVTNLVFQHKPRPHKIKKEDLLLINQKTRTTDKIFFNKDIYDSWNFDQSQLISYGIPLESFTNNSNDRPIDVLILSNDRMISQQIYGHFIANDTKCETLTTMHNLRIEEVNKKFNESKIIIDLENNTINQLCALACGCYVLCLSENTQDILYIQRYQSIDDMVYNCNKILNANSFQDTKAIKEYLNETFNYDQFKKHISQIMELNKRKAFIL